MKAMIVRLGPPIAAAAAVGLFVSSPAVAGADRIRNEGPLVSYCVDDPASEIAASSPRARWVRCASRLLAGIAVVLPVAVLSLLVTEAQVGVVPTLGVGLEMAALLLIGPSVGFALWAWTDRAQSTYAAAGGVHCFTLALWMLPIGWSVINYQPWGPPWEAVLMRWSGLALLGAAIVAATWRDPFTRR